MWECESWGIYFDTGHKNRKKLTLPKTNSSHLKIGLSIQKDAGLSPFATIFSRAMDPYNPIIPVV